MVLLNTVSTDEAIKAFADYCSQNSTPEDIFNFDGNLPQAKLKFCPLLAYYAEYSYTALVEITTETEYNSQSSLAPNSSQYRYNQRNTDSGFFSSMYEDYSDTRYTQSVIKQKNIDRSYGESNCVVFDSASMMCPVSSKLWPSESIDTSLFIEDINSYEIRTNELLSQAIDLCVSTFETKEAEFPAAKASCFINRDIDSIIRNKYIKCNFEIIDIDYQINENSLCITPFFFPFYEFTFTYNGLPYCIKIAAHTESENSTGFLGGKKAVVEGNLPSFEKMPGSIFKKISDRRNRKNVKKTQKDFFLNNTAKRIVFTF